MIFFLSCLQAFATLQQDWLVGQPELT